MMIDHVEMKITFNDISNLLCIRIKQKYTLFISLVDIIITLRYKSKPTVISHIRSICKKIISFAGNE